MRIADELLHMIKQTVQQAMIDQRPFVYGHISSYDPATHSVRAIIPSMRDDDGTPILTPWIPMGTLMAGAGSGIQVVYSGGATFDNPTSGEQILIGLFDRQRGVSAVPSMFFNGNSLPPATNLPSGSAAAAPGDVLISNPSGTLIRLHANGDFEVNGQGKLIANVTGDADITTQGTANIVATAINFASGLGHTLRGLCTSVFKTWADGHVHLDSRGGTTSAPTTTAGANALTTVVQAE